MPYTVKDTRSYEQSNTILYQAAQKAVAGLEGKVLAENVAENSIHAQFHKRIHGKVLGDRTQIHIGITSAADNQSTIDIEVYPVNPVGQKLQFGARKGVVSKVVGWFWAHFDHNINKMTDG